jgi:hypothetical protein
MAEKPDETTPETTAVVIDQDSPPAQPQDPAPAAGRGRRDAGPLTETVPGGRYRVGDQLVNANGEPIKDKAKD